MDDELKKQAEELGKAFANSFFNIFTDPTMRGPNFTWEKFPHIAAGLAEVQTFTNFPIDQEFMEEIEKVCYESCLKEAIELVKKRIDKKFLEETIGESV